VSYEVHKWRFKDTDKHWEYWGKHNPYYGVFASDKHLNQNINDEVLNTFFDSGQAHIDAVFRTIHTYVDLAFQPARALDFGCGVGRLTIPLATRAGSVVGVDVSPSMLEEARKNCVERNLRNMEFVVSDDTLSKVPGSFDFIHSYIIFQHIPIKRGEELLQRLVDALAENGVGALILRMRIGCRPPCNGESALTRPFPGCWVCATSCKADRLRSR
jgi:SAM-dependent methyltransferase